MPHRIFKSRSLTLTYIAFGLVMIMGFSIVGSQIKSSPAPLYSIDQPVHVTSKVPGVEGPAVKVGATGLPVHVAHLCINDKHPVVITATNTYTQLDRKNLVVGSFPKRPITATFSVNPGCTSSYFTNPLAEPLLPGSWRQVSVLTVVQTQGGRSENHTVLSEIFKVVP